MLNVDELQLAWQRVKIDHPNRCFVEHPYLFSWIEADLPGWLDNLATQLREGYTPHDCVVCKSPKPGWMVRPGAVLDLADEVVFNAVIGNFLPQIWNAVGRFQGDPDIAYQLKSTTHHAKWISSGFLIWREWRQKSLEKMKAAVQFVVFADIAGFYENIDLLRLRSDLAALSVNQGLLDKVLMPCLNRWSQPRNKGIPQGYSASDILAKVYINPLDQGLRNAEFIHLRYVDDIRIFCRNNLEAKRALLTLSDLLRNRGLNLQSAKTEILRADEAKSKIDGVAPVIQSISEQLKEQLQELWGSGPYATLEDIERFAQFDSEAPPLEVLEQAFHDHFLLEPTSDFNKTLFHYLLNRLGKAKSNLAVSYCLDLLARRPDETEDILRYFFDIELSDDYFNVILSYTSSPDAIYDYQLYQIVKWFYERSLFPEKLVALCRRWAFDKNRDPWLRSYSIAALGAAGDPSDLDQLETQYGSAASDKEKAEIVAATVRMEISRRNSFYGRIRNDGQLVRRATEQARHWRSRVS